MDAKQLFDKQAELEARASAASAPGIQALRRLLVLAETRDSGQIRVIARFLGAIWNGTRHFDLYDLRALDVEISDDMLRWGRVAIDEQVEGRVEAILKDWGMYGPDQTGQFIAGR